MVDSISMNLMYGCRKVSDGCKNCYIARYPFAYQTRRFGMKTPFEGRAGFFNFENQARKVSKMPPNSVIFVNALSDTFGEFVPDRILEEWHKYFASNPQYQFMFLTKRTGRMEVYYRSHNAPDNLWVGTTIESRKYLRRLDILKRIKARIKWVGFTPLLEDIGDVDLHDIQLASVGGESGSNHRPFDVAWARNILRICRRDGVAFGFLGTEGFANNALDGVIYDEMPINVKLLPFKA